MLVADGQLDCERVALGHEDLEDEELVHDVEALGDADSLRRRCVDACVMKIGLQLGRVRWQLYPLILQVEYVAFDVWVEVLDNLGGALTHGERFLRLRS